jgi:flagellar biosynthesis/type III secretory pathway chaperone
MDALQERLEVFLDLLTQEHEAIGALALDRLGEINRGKLQLLEELNSLDRERACLVGQMANLWSLEPASVTLGSIAHRVGGEVGGRLKRQQNQLNESIAAVRERNQFISSLLGRSLTFLHEALRIWYTPESSPAPLYCESGAMRSAQSEGSLLRRKG